MPSSCGSIQICSSRTGCVLDPLNSLWKMPVPALMRCACTRPDLTF